MRHSIRARMAHRLGATYVEAPEDADAAVGYTVEFLRRNIRRRDRRLLTSRVLVVEWQLTEPAAEVLLWHASGVPRNELPAVLSRSADGTKSRVRTLCQMASAPDLKGVTRLVDARAAELFAPR